MSPDASPGLLRESRIVRAEVKVAQDCILGHFQPSPFDRLRAGSTGQLVGTWLTQD